MGYDYFFILFSFKKYAKYANYCRFACGMIKNPTQARFQFNQDHPDLVNAKNPATNNHVAK